MPTYEWKHEDGTLVDVRRSVSDINEGPREDEVPDGYDTEGWHRIISRSTIPFEHLRDRGVFERTHWKPNRKI